MTGQGRDVQVSQEGIYDGVTASSRSGTYAGARYN